MFEDKTFDSILQEMLDRVPDDIDKLPGSVIYDALAPTAMELAELYANMDMLKDSTFADTADGEDLEMRVSEQGITRKEATPAIRKGVFTDTQSMPFEVPIGSRFLLGSYTYFVSDLIEVGTYKMVSETAGVTGNRDFGEMLPIEPIDGLGSAYLMEVLIPGADAEDDKELYLKYQEHLQEKPFGGNRSDYKKKIMDIQGVGGVQLYRTPMGGGTVRAVIIDSTFNVPSQELVDSVQGAVDPIPYKGEGYGTAPIGHEVVVEGVEATTIDTVATLVLSGVTLGQIEALIREAIQTYLEELRKQWNKGASIVIRITQIESRILMIDGVQDITGTTINGAPDNLTLSSEIPIIGAVVMND